MPLNIGTTAAKKVFFGTTEIKKIFSGTTQVWASEDPYVYVVDNTGTQSTSFLRKYDVSDLLTPIVSVSFQTLGFSYSSSYIKLTLMDDYLYMFSAGMTNRIYKLSKEDFSVIGYGDTAYYYGTQNSAPQNTTVKRVGQNLGIFKDMTLDLFNPSTMAMISYFGFDTGQTNNIYYNDFDDTHFYGVCQVPRTSTEAIYKVQLSTMTLVSTLSELTPVVRYGLATETGNDYIYVAIKNSTTKTMDFEKRRKSDLGLVSTTSMSIVSAQHTPPAFFTPHMYQVNVSNMSTLKAKSLAGIPDSSASYFTLEDGVLTWLPLWNVGRLDTGYYSSNTWYQFTKISNDLELGLNNFVITNNGGTLRNIEFTSNQYGGAFHKDSTYGYIIGSAAYNGTNYGVGVVKFNLSTREIVAYNMGVYANANASMSYNSGFLSDNDYLYIASFGYPSKYIKVAKSNLSVIGSVDAAPLYFGMDYPIQYLSGGYFWGLNSSTYQVTRFNASTMAVSPTYNFGTSSNAGFSITDNTYLYTYSSNVFYKNRLSDGGVQAQVTVSATYIGCNSTHALFYLTSPSRIIVVDKSTMVATTYTPAGLLVDAMMFCQISDTHLIAPKFTMKISNGDTILYENRYNYLKKEYGKNECYTSYYTAYILEVESDNGLIKGLPLKKTSTYQTFGNKIK